MQLLVPMDLPPGAPAGTQPLFRGASIQEFNNASKIFGANNNPHTAPFTTSVNQVNEGTPRNLAPLETPTS